MIPPSEFYDLPSARSQKKIGREAQRVPTVCVEFIQLKGLLTHELGELGIELLLIVKATQEFTVAVDDKLRGDELDSV